MRDIMDSSEPDPSVNVIEADLNLPAHQQDTRALPDLYRASQSPKLGNDRLY
jgi:hypothetical protein